ncbi:MAG: baseplate J/gp47 family protein [Ktedonobacteraceae bacterium]
MRAYQDDQRDEDEMEIIHVYMLREPLPDEQQSGNRWATILHWIMGCLAVLLLSGFCLIPDSPVLVTRTISVPVIPLPLVQLTARVSIVPTGVSTIPALQARGTLTIYNGSILQEALPAGFIVTTHNGIEIATDQAVIVPVNNPPTDGVATVAAHAVTAGAAGNIAPGRINQADGTSLVVKNLTAFTGGQDASSELFITSGDVQHALTTARAHLATQQLIGLLPKPCTEQSQQNGSTLTLFWRCQYITYHVPPGVIPIGVRVQGHRVSLTYRYHPPT